MKLFSFFNKHKRATTFVEMVLSLGILGLLAFLILAVVAGRIKAPGITGYFLDYSKVGICRERLADGTCNERKGYKIFSSFNSLNYDKATKTANKEGNGVPCRKITDISDLLKIQNQMPGYDLDGCYVLMNDINFEKTQVINQNNRKERISVDGKDCKTNTCEKVSKTNPYDYTWKGIGSENKPFTGAFLGNGKIIYNFHSKTGIGLFNNISTEATVQDFGIHNSSIQTDGENAVGFLAKEISGNATDKIEIRNVYLHNSSIKGSGKQQAAGGLIGLVNKNTNVQLTYAYNGAPQETAGGLIGQVWAKTLILKRCKNLNSITSDAPTVGGLVGVIGLNPNQNRYIEISLSSNLGGKLTANGTDITGLGATAGGLIGGIDLVSGDKALIKKSWAHTDVIGSYEAAGLVGRVSNSTIENSYFIGKAEGGRLAGGIIGYAGDNTRLDKVYSIAEAKTTATKYNHTPGGIFGDVATNTTTVNNVFWDKNKTPDSIGFLSKNCSVTGKPQEMKLSLNGSSYDYSLFKAAGFEEPQDFDKVDKNGNPIRKSVWKNGEYRPILVENPEILTEGSLISSPCDHPCNIYGKCEGYGELLTQCNPDHCCGEETCADGTPHCSTNEDCGRGMECDTAGSRCCFVPDTETTKSCQGATCTTERCENGSCAINSDCQEGFYCYKNCCVANTPPKNPANQSGGEEDEKCGPKNPVCYSDQDCGKDLRCIMGCCYSKCGNNAASCTDYAQCPTTVQCNKNGCCEMCKDGKSYCEKDADCKNGEVCAGNCCETCSEKCVNDQCSNGKICNKYNCCILEDVCSAENKCSADIQCGAGRCEGGCCRGGGEQCEKPCSYDSANCPEYMQCNTSGCCELTPCETSQVCQDTTYTVQNNDQSCVVLLIDDSGSMAEDYKTHEERVNYTGTSFKSKYTLLKETLNPLLNCNNPSASKLNNIYLGLRFYYPQTYGQKVITVGKNNVTTICNNINAISDPPKQQSTPTGTKMAAAIYSDFKNCPAGFKKRIINLTDGEWKDAPVIPKDYILGEGDYLDEIEADYEQCIAVLNKDTEEAATKENKVFYCMIYPVGSTSSSGAYPKNTTNSAQEKPNLSLKGHRDFAIRTITYKLKTDIAATKTVNVSLEDFKNSQNGVVDVIGFGVGYGPRYRNMAFTNLMGGSYYDANDGEALTKAFAALLGTTSQKTFKDCKSYSRCTSDSDCGQDTGLTCQSSCCRESRESQCRAICGGHTYNFGDDICTVVVVDNSDTMSDAKKRTLISTYKSLFYESENKVKPFANVMRIGLSFYHDCRYDLSTKEHNCASGHILKPARNQIEKIKCLIENWKYRAIEMPDPAKNADVITVNECKVGAVSEHFKNNQPEKKTTQYWGYCNGSPFLNALWAAQKNFPDDCKTKRVLVLTDSTSLDEADRHFPDKDLKVLQSYLNENKNVQIYAFVTDSSATQCKIRDNVIKAKVLKYGCGSNWENGFAELLNIPTDESYDSCIYSGDCGN